MTKKKCGAVKERFDRGLEGAVKPLQKRRDPVAKPVKYVVGLLQILDAVLHNVRGAAGRGRLECLYGCKIISTLLLGLRYCSYQVLLSA